MEPTATILHADLDAFYASVEQLLDPSLRGRPVAVGGGVVLAASYEAKAFGVRGGMPGRRGRELCPQLTFVPGHFKEYQRLGAAAIKVLGDFTPLVERISIDEAFADVAGCTHLFGPPPEIAQAIRRRVRDELGLPISVGVARTKHLAKIASQVAKPDGLVVVVVRSPRAGQLAKSSKVARSFGSATRARLHPRVIRSALSGWLGWADFRIWGPLDAPAAAHSPTSIRPSVGYLATFKRSRCWTGAHGGLSPGAPKGNKNALEHGHYTAEAIWRRRQFSGLIRDMRALINEPK
jgi:DNA polymerase-4